MTQKVYLHFVALALVLLGASSSTPQCEDACKVVVESNENRAAMFQSCQKHNIVPRPTTHDICTNTYVAYQKSACLNACDDGATPIDEDVCPGVATASWISKHSAYKSCRSGYKGAKEHVPNLFHEMLETNDQVKDIMSVANFRYTESEAPAVAEDVVEVRHSEEAPPAAQQQEEEEKEEEAPIVASPSSAHTATEQTEEEWLGLTDEEEDSLRVLLHHHEVDFPISIDEHGEVHLKLSGEEDLSSQLLLFCDRNMPSSSTSKCVHQLYPVLKAKLEQLEVEGRFDEDNRSAFRGGMN